MTRALFDVLQEIEQLLVACGWREQADWVCAKRASLAAAQPGSDRFRQELQGLRRAVGGTGSFSRLPLVPSELSGMTPAETLRRQWALAAELGELLRLDSPPVDVPS